LWHYNKILQAGSFIKKRNLFLSGLKAGKSKMKALAGSHETLLLINGTS
jgi:hypothetical protein